MTQNYIALNDDVLQAVRHRRSAGESLGKLAREIGLPWQRLWTMLYQPAAAAAVEKLPLVRPTSRSSRRCIRCCNSLISCTASLKQGFTSTRSGRRLQFPRKPLDVPWLHLHPDCQAIYAFVCP